MPLPCGRVCWGCVANSPRPPPEDPCILEGKTRATFPKIIGPQPSGAIEETGTIFESTLCCVVHQYKDRWPSTPPPPMSVRKCRPLERILFLNEFRRAHLDFWKNNHPSYPDFSLGSLPPLVRRIYRVGQGYRKPKDVIPPPSGGNIEPTIVPEIARLRASKNDRLAKTVWTLASCARVCMGTGGGNRCRGRK